MGGRGRDFRSGGWDEGSRGGGKKEWETDRGVGVTWDGGKAYCNGGKGGFREVCDEPTGKKAPSLHF